MDCDAWVGAPWPEDEADARPQDGGVRWTRPEPDVLRQIIAELRQLA